MLLRASVATCLAWAALSLLHDDASAQEILLGAPETAVDSVHDNPIGGAAEMVQDPPYISLQASREWRAFAEYDISAATGAVLSRASFSGDVAVNNAVDRGTRTIEIGIYAADGAVTLDDFDRPTTALGTVSYAPPADTRVSFSYEILAQVEALLASGATHVGFRARSTTPDAPNVLSMLVLELATNCGNGVVDAPEECDDGSANSDTVPDACRSDCTDATCGDGIVDTGESCDDGEANGPGAACTNACMPPDAADAGPDATTPDAAAPDATAPDAATSDASTPPDAATSDATTPDSAPADGSSLPDGGTSPGGDASCACRVTGVGDGDLACLCMLTVAVALARRRRKPRAPRR